MIPIQMDVFRRIFNLEEVRDARTKRIITPASYQNYKDIKQNILEVAQKELYDLYSNGFSNLWFDYQEGAKKGRGGKVLSIVVYIYTKVYKHNNIVKFALQESLKEFGWSLSPMQKRRKSKKEVVETEPVFISFNFSKVVKSTQNATDSNT